MAITVGTSLSILSGTNFGSRKVVRNSSGIPYVVVLSTSGTNHISVWKGNSATPTSFTEQDTGNDPTNANYEMPTAAIDSGDIIHIAYWNDDTKDSTLRYVTFNASTDAYAGDVEVESISSTALNPNVHIAVDSNDIPHIAWIDSHADMGSDFNNAFYTNRIGGSWSTALNVVGEESVQHEVFGLTIDHNDLPIIIARTPSDPEGYQGNANDATSFTLSAIASTRDHCNVCQDSENNYWVVCKNDTGNDDVELYRKLDTDSWTSSWTLFTNNDDAANTSEITLAAVGRDIHVFFNDLSNDLWTNKYDDAGSSWDTATELVDAITNVGLSAKWAYHVNFDSAGTNRSASNSAIPEIDYIYEAPQGTVLWDNISLAADPVLDAAAGVFALTGTVANLLHNPLVEAGSGTFTLTGTNVDFILGTVLSADAGSFVLTGTAVDLRHFKLTADSGGFTLTGQAANLLHNPLVEADSGTFVLTGQAANLLKGTLVVADSGTFTLTGQVVNLLFNHVLEADSGSFVLTGTAADLRHFKLDAASGTFVLTGQTANLLIGYLLEANSSSFALTGQAANLLKDSLIEADSGSFVLTGIAANLLNNRLIEAASGSFNLTGLSADLRHFKLNAESGSFTLTGQTANLLHNPLVEATSGTFVLTGLDATLIDSGAGGTVMEADSGTFALTGQSANLLHNPLVEANAGSFTLIGTDANLLKGYNLIAEQGNYSLVGQSVNLLFDKVVEAEQGSFILTGINVDLVKNTRLIADSGSFVLTGTDADLRHFKLDAVAGSFVLTGQDAALSKDTRVSADSGTFVFTGQTAELLFGHVIEADIASLILTGTDADLKTEKLVADLGAFSFVGLPSTNTLRGHVLRVFSTIPI